MKESSRTSCQLTRSLILIAIVGSLCFSAGEGLRLRPFPVAALTPIEGSNVQLDAYISHEISLYKYGPLDVPQTHNYSKRKAIEFASPPSMAGGEIPIYLGYASNPELRHTAFSLSVSRPAGRAPPLRS